MNLLSVLLIVTTLVTDAPSTEVYLSGHYGESTYAIEGNQNAGFSVQAQSVYDIDSISRVFGEASYSWNQSRGNRFVENADYELLSPYLTVDTVGGGMRTETYFFRGGYRMVKNQVLWYAALQFRALQSYRDVDPRPKNKVADLQVEAGVGYSNERYAWVGITHVGRYKQNNEIRFYSELGENQIYHLIAPGTAYTRFSGSQKVSYYHGFSIGQSVAMMPHQTGWLAQVDYQYFRVNKELYDVTYIPISRLQVHAADATFGYVGNSWRAMLEGGIYFRRGQQYIYGEAANNTYEFLTRQANYAENMWHIGAAGEYNLSLPVGELSFAAAIDYDSSETTSLPPEKRWAVLYNLLTENALNAELGISYTFPIKGRFCWFIAPKASYTQYVEEPSKPFTWNIILETGITF